MRNSRALLIIGVALFLALASVLVAAKWMSEQGVAGTRVAVASADIVQGSKLAEDSVQLAEWPAGSVPPGAITDLKVLENRIVRSDVARGEPILESKLAPPGTTGGLSAVATATRVPETPWSPIHLAATSTEARARNRATPMIGSAFVFRIRFSPWCRRCGGRCQA